MNLKKAKALRRQAVEIIKAPIAYVRTRKGTVVLEPTCTHGVYKALKRGKNQ
jgi:hypothetical protein